MKLPWEKKHLCWGITAFLTIAASILFLMALLNWSVVGGVLGIIVKSLRPITYGLIIAYLLNPLMNVIEHSFVYPVIKRIFRKNTKRAHSVSRWLSIIFSWAIALFAVHVLVSMVMPEIITSVEDLVSKLPEYANRVMIWGEKFLRENPEVLEFLENSVSGFTTNITELAKRFEEIIPNLNFIISRLTSSIYGVLTALLNIIVGIIVSVYVLKDKEKFTAQIKRILYSSFSTEKANGVIAVSRLTHDKFGNFITGKIFDSFIIGILCFIILSIFRIPYTALISVIVGVTNVIPFFGPFIGAIPSALLLLITDPMKCLTFVIIIIFLQQFDGNILGPKILGSTTGISSFWVVFSILVGSGLFGVWGMVCAVPLFAVIYALIREGCHKSLRKKGIDYSPETYENIDHIDEKTNGPVWLDKD